MLAKILFATFWLVFLVVAVVAARARREVWREGVSATGTVVRLERRVSYAFSRARTALHPVLRFRTPDGVEHEVESRGGASPSGVHIGERVPVNFPPGRPQEASHLTSLFVGFDYSRGQWAVVIIFMSLFVLALLVLPGGATVFGVIGGLLVLAAFYLFFGEQATRRNAVELHGTIVSVVEPGPEVIALGRRLFRQPATIRFRHPEGHVIEFSEQVAPDMPPGLPVQVHYNLRRFGSASLKKPRSLRVIAVGLGIWGVLAAVIPVLVQARP